MVATRRDRSRTMSTDEGAASSKNLEDEIRRIEEQAREEVKSPPSQRSSARRSRSRTLSKDILERPARNLEEEIQLIEEQARKETIENESEGTSAQNEQRTPKTKSGSKKNDESKSKSRRSSNNKNGKKERPKDKVSELTTAESSQDAGTKGAKIDGERDVAVALKNQVGMSTTATKKKALGSTKNDLTHLIPGYTAARKLNTSSLDKYRPVGGLLALQRQAEKSDRSTKSFVPETSQAHIESMTKRKGAMMPSSYTSAYASFKKGTKRQPDTSAGAGWFGMKPTSMTDEVKTDLAVIKNRNYLDPKRFYKSSDKFGSVLQVGTVIEGATEYYSSRLTKKQRRTNITEEIMADPSSADYTRRKFGKMQREREEEAKKRKIKPKKKARRGF